MRIFYLIFQKSWTFVSSMEGRTAEILHSSGKCWKTFSPNNQSKANIRLFLFFSFVDCLMVNLQHMPPSTWVIIFFCD